MAFPWAINNNCILHSLRYRISNKQNTRNITSNLIIIFLDNSGNLKMLSISSTKMIDQFFIIVKSIFISACMHAWFNLIYTLVFLCMKMLFLSKPHVFSSFLALAMKLTVTLLCHNILIHG